MTAVAFPGPAPRSPAFGVETYVLIISDFDRHRVEPVAQRVALLQRIQQLPAQRRRQAPETELMRLQPPWLLTSPLLAGRPPLHRPV